jgi:hypothetical protein
MRTGSACKIVKFSPFCVIQQHGLAEGGKDVTGLDEVSD